MPPRNLKPRKQTRLDNVAFRDLVVNASDKADSAIGDACQLMEVNSQQYLLALNVICNLILRVGSMLTGDQHRPSRETIDHVLFDIKSVFDRTEK